MKCNIRFCQTHDIGSLLSIEAESFDKPWNTGDFNNVITKSKQHIMVALNNTDSLIGYIAYEMIDNKGIDILRIAVDTRYRRQGVASSLLTVIQAKLTNTRNYISVAVDETNLAAQLFFGKSGFDATEILTKEGNGVKITSYQMEYLLIPTEVNTI